MVAHYFVNDENIQLRWISSMNVVSLYNFMYSLIKRIRRII